MIGLELLQSVQIIYFVYLINDDVTTPFGIFMFMANLAYNFSFSENQSTNIYSSKLNGEFNIENSNLSQMIMSASVLIPIVLLGTLLLLKKAK